MDEMVRPTWAEGNEELLREMELAQDMQAVFPSKEHAEKNDLLGERRIADGISEIRMEETGMGTKTEDGKGRTGRAVALVGGRDERDRRWDQVLKEMLRQCATQEEDCQIVVVDGEGHRHAIRPGQINPDGFTEGPLKSPFMDLAMDPMAKTADLGCAYKLMGRYVKKEPVAARCLRNGPYKSYRVSDGMSRQNHTRKKKGKRRRKG